MIGFGVDETGMVRVRFNFKVTSLLVVDTDSIVKLVFSEMTPREGRLLFCLSTVGVSTSTLFSNEDWETVVVLMICGGDGENRVLGVGGFLGGV